MSRANSCLVEEGGGGWGGGGGEISTRGLIDFFFLRDQSADELKSIA